MEHNLIKDFLGEKDSVTFFVPKPLIPSRYDSFVVELLERVHAYIIPIPFGLDRVDVFEFLTDKKFSDIDLLDFLKYKRYLVEITDFETLFLKYSQLSAEKIKGIEVSLSSIKNFDLRLEAKIVSLVQLTGVQTTFPYRISDATLKEVIYNCKNRKFRHLRATNKGSAE